MHTSKFAKTLGVNKIEAEIGLRVMRESIPITFGMVEESSKEAFRDGYILFSPKAGTKRWFGNVVREKLKGSTNTYDSIRKRRFMEAIDVESAARNGKIQGLQSDMLKRALRLLREKRKLGIPLTLMGHVHDETHTGFPDYMTTCYYDGKKISNEEADKLLEADLKLDPSKRLLSYTCPYIEKIVKKVMKDAANYYLDTNIITMDSSAEISPVLKK